VQSKEKENSTKAQAYRTTRRDINQRGNILWLPGAYAKTRLSASFLISLSSKSSMVLRSCAQEKLNRQTVYVSPGKDYHVNLILGKDTAV
jgi:hypothetical protein